MRRSRRHTRKCPDNYYLSSTRSNICKGEKNLGQEPPGPTTSSGMKREGQSDREKWKKRKGVGENIPQHENAHIKYMFSISCGSYKNDRCSSISAPIICQGRDFN